jgi:hypothetical protein
MQSCQKAWRWPVDWSKHVACDKHNKLVVPDVPSSSSSGDATTLGGFWPALWFHSTVFYLCTSLSNFSLFLHSNFLLSFSNRSPFHALVVLFYIHQNYSLGPSQQCKFFQGAVAGRTPNPLPRRTGVSLLVWVIPFDLSGKGGPTSSNATTGIALRIIWPLKPSHYFKAQTPSGGPDVPWFYFFSTSK